MVVISIDWEGLRRVSNSGWTSVGSTLRLASAAYLVTKCKCIFQPAQVTFISPSIFISANKKYSNYFIPQRQSPFPCSSCSRHWTSASAVQHSHWNPSSTVGFSLDQRKSPSLLLGEPHQSFNIFKLPQEFGKNMCIFKSYVCLDGFLPRPHRPPSTEPLYAYGGQAKRSDEGARIFGLLKATKYVFM